MFTASKNTAEFMCVTYLRGRAGTVLQSEKQEI